MVYQNVQLAAPEPVATSFAAVEARLLKWQNDNVAYAVAHSAPLRLAITQAEQELKVVRGAPSKEQQNAKVCVPELANQCEIVAANFCKSLRARGDTYRAEADNGEQQIRADATKAVMDIQLDSHRCDSEVSLGLRRYVRHKLSGLRLCIDRREVTESVRAEAQPGAELPPDARMVYEDPAMQSLLYETVESKAKQTYWFRSLDVRNVAFADLRRRVNRPQEQPSLHERFSLTKQELRENGTFRNLDAVGMADAGQNHHIEQVADYSLGETTPGTVGHPNFQTWAVWNSWSKIPWEDWLDAGDFSIEELALFAEFHGFDPNECMRSQFWEHWHTQDTNLKVSPNWMRDKHDVPFRFGAYHPGDYEMGGGESFADYIADIAKAIEAMVNLGKDNAMLRHYGSVILDENAMFDLKKLEELYKPKGKVVLQLGAFKAEDKIHHFGKDVPDITGSTMTWVSNLKGMSNQMGAPDVIQGTGNADTATEQISNANRGQDKLDDPFYRWVQEQYVPMLEMVRDQVFLNFNDEAWVTKIGEMGSLFVGPKRITPANISRRFKIICTANFDFGNRQQKMQSLLGAMNVLSRAPQDPILLKVFGILLHLNGYSYREIEDITGNFGAETTPEDELVTMLYNQDEHPSVLPTDDHQTALITAITALRDPKFAPLAEQYNFNEWVRKHQEFMQLQQMLMMQQAQEQAALSPPNPSRPGSPGEQPGRPVGGGAGPESEGNGAAKQVAAPTAERDDTNDARQGAQNQPMVGRGIQSAGGLTGRAMP